MNPDTNTNETTPTNETTSALNNVSYQRKKKNSFKRKYANSLQDVPYDDKKLSSISVFFSSLVTTDELERTKALMETISSNLQWKGDINQKESLDKNGKPVTILFMNRFAKKVVPTVESTEAFINGLFGNSTR